MNGRRTVARQAAVRGTGLFTGAPVELTFRPARSGAGITFRRTDLTGAPTVAALVRNVMGETARAAANIPAHFRNTMLADGKCVVATTEHVLSALAGLGVTDVAIDLNAMEAPIGDGSAAAFVQTLAEAGSEELEGAPEPVVVTREVTIQGRGGERIVARPATRARFVYELDYGPGAPIGPQMASWSPGEEYARRVAPARTFCLETEARMMRAAGLFANLSPRDMLVFGTDGPIDNTLRFPDEPARHKLLDLIGDLALVGRPIQAEIVATRGGHALNHALGLALAAL